MARIYLSFADAWRIVLHSEQQTIEPNCDLFIFDSKHFTKISNDRFSVQKDEERIILSVLRDHCQSIKDTEDLKEIRVLEELAVLDQFYDLIICDVDYRCFAHGLP